MAIMLLEDHEISYVFFPNITSGLARTKHVRSIIALIDVVSVSTTTELFMINSFIIVDGARNTDTVCQRNHAADGDVAVERRL